MKLAVVGTGYVGLVTGACLAEMGNDVTCVDNDSAKVARLQAGEIPIYEPGLNDLVVKNVAEDTLRFTTSLEEGVKNAKAIFLALPTPPGKDGSADLSYILGVAAELGPLLTDYVVVIDKSTVPVGTGEKMRKAIAKKTKVDFDIVSNPEFLRESFAVDDFMNPDRVVIGTDSKQAEKVMRQIYRPFVLQGNPLYFMDLRSAEMTKYAANTFLAVKISFMNDIANLCEMLDANVDYVRLGIGADERIGKRFLFPGIGYGGSCFPKDVKALRHAGREAGYRLRILEAASEVNEAQKKILVKKILAYYDGSIRGKTFALWGLAFKPDTDDIREAPALEIIKGLTAAGAKVIAYDPEAMDNVKKQLKISKGLSFVEYQNEALKSADALIIATEWPQFRSVDLEKIKALLKVPVIFDGRNVYELDTMKELKFDYTSIGRADVRRKATK